MIRNTGILLIGFILYGFVGTGQAEDLASYSDELQRKFSDVKFIPTDELAKSLPDSSALLIDAREPEEFAVSRLPGAVLAGKPLVPWVNSLHRAKDQRVIVYCSVGYRSAILAHELQDAGFTNVLNLRGSIFAWANEERPLENSDGPTHHVHPFDATWGQFLEKSKWRWSPAR